MFIAIILVIIGSVIWYKLKYARDVGLLNMIPGPPTLPIIGNVHQVYTTPDKIWSRLRQFSDRYYPMYRLWYFNERKAMLRHPDEAEIILKSTKHLTKGPMYYYLHSWLGTGLLLSTGAKMINRRKLLTPAFHFNVLNQFVEIFDIQAQHMVDSVKNSGKEIHNVAPLVTSFALNTICETAMGARALGQDKLKEDFQAAVHNMAIMLFHQILNPLAKVDWLFKLLPTGRRATRAVDTLHEFSGKIIEERRKYHEENHVTDVAGMANEEDHVTDDRKADDGLPKRRVALLDLLIQLEKRSEIDESGIREEVDTFISAGHDTTANAMTFAVLLLAEHEEIQQKAREEVNKVFKESDGKLGMAQLQSLVYLERCMKESLRLYPSVPNISRVAAEDVQMRGYLIPKGTTMALSIYDLHRDPNFWPNPHEYNPDRFLPEVIKHRHPYSYIPFSAGLRNCIGQKFAILELKSSMAHLLHNFYLRPVDRTKDMTLQASIILRSAHPLRVKFIPIKK